MLGSVALVACVYLVMVCPMPVFADGNMGQGGNESATNPTNCDTQTVGTCNGGGVGLRAIFG